MENNYKEIKKKKRRLKPFVKLILFILFLGIIFFILYKQNFFSSAKSFFQKSYLSVKNLIYYKNINSNSETKEESDNNFVSVFKKRLPSQNISFASSTLMPNGDMKIFLKNTKDEVGYLFVNTKDNVEEVWTTFASVLIADPIKNLFTKNLSDLNYIDLRFKNKVFYKFNGVNNSNSAPNTISASTTITNSTSSAPTSTSTNTN